MLFEHLVTPFANVVGLWSSASDQAFQNEGVQFDECVGSLATSKYREIPTPIGKRANANHFPSCDESVDHCLVTGIYGHNAGRIEIKARPTSALALMQAATLTPTR